MSEKNAHPGWDQWKNYLELTYGKGAFVSKAWLLAQLARPVSSVPRPEVMPTAPTTLPAAAQVRVAVRVAEEKQQPARVADSLDAIRADLGDCTRCKLCAGRKNIVFGEGAPKAELMFIGEGPGEQEDVQGRPFVGKAGQLLDKIIEAMGYKRKQVYIANVVKCRPPNNRAPEPDEAGVCEQFLFRQIESIKPKVMVALGGTALKCLLHQDDAKITKMRGKFLEFRGAKLMPTYHPAYLLRNPDGKKDVWEDMKKVKAELARGDA